MYKVVFSFTFTVFFLYYEILQLMFYEILEYMQT